MTWSIANMPSMEGKTVIITGANVGLGLETSLQIAKKGGHVFMACRSKDKGEEAIAQIKKEVPDAKVDFLHLILHDLKQVKAAAESWLEKGLPLHVLINNAGIMACPYKLSKDGIESQFQTNHLGHFLLTQTLLPRIVESQPSRIVNVSSSLHSSAKDGIDLDKINDQTSYDPWKQYGITKLSNILFTNLLNEKLKDEKVYCNSLHPGIVRTELLRGPEQTYGFFFKILKHLFRAASLSVEKGALSQLFLATSEDVESKPIRGQFYDPLATPSKPYTKWGTDAQLAQKLWDYSEKVLNEKLAA